MQLHWLFAFISIITMSCASPEKKDTEMRYLALGDSYTIGESVEEKMRYPAQITDTLEGLGWCLKDPEIIAVTGWTSGELMKGIEDADPTGPYQLVSLLIGVNNQYRGMDIEIYRKEFMELLNQAIAYAGNEEKRVLVLSIPDWGVMPFADKRDGESIAAEIDQYNKVNKEITMAKNVAWVDVTGISRMAADDPSLIASDGLHPSGCMYELWVEAALPEVLRILEDK